MGFDRGFVAAYPPQSVVDRLGAISAYDDPGTRWVPSEQWHITLRFLGDHADLRTVDERLQTGFVHPVVDVAIGPKLGHFGGRVLHAPVLGIDSVANAVDEALGGVVPARKTRFSGHLTLGRGRRPANRLPLVGTPFEASWSVGQICLVHSKLSPKGAIHTVIGRYPLSPG